MEVRVELHAKGGAGHGRVMQESVREIGPSQYSPDGETGKMLTLVAVEIGRAGAVAAGEGVGRVVNDHSYAWISHDALQQRPR